METVEIAQKYAMAVLHTEEKVEFLGSGFFAGACIGSFIVFAICFIAYAVFAIRLIINWDK